MFENKKQEFEKRLSQHIKRIYKDNLKNEEIDSLSEKLLEHIICSQSELPTHITEDGIQWSEKTAILITYADSIEDKKNLPIKAVNNFMKNHCVDIFEAVHILPFFPSSSDKGFSVVDYYTIYHNFGQWNDVLNISKHFGVMADVVLNHGSSKSKWFKNFIKGDGKGYDYFLNFEQKFDTSKVV